MKVSQVRSLNILCFCPDSRHVLYISLEILAANCRFEKPNWLVVLRSRLSSSFAELKVDEHAANAVTVGIVEGLPGVLGNKGT